MTGTELSCFYSTELSQHCQIHVLKQVSKSSGKLFQCDCSTLDMLMFRASYALV